jgi:hypothetical protein
MATLSLQGQGKIILGTVSVNLPSIADGDVGEATVTITGAEVGDSVVINAPAAGLTAGMAICEARVSAADTVKIRAVNGSGGTVDEAAVTCAYCLIRD